MTEQRTAEVLVVDDIPENLLMFGSLLAMPGVRPAARAAVAEPDEAPARSRRASRGADETAPTKKTDARDGSAGKAETATGKKASSQLLVRALELMHERDDEDWLHTSELKRQMVRLDPAFNEKAIGYSTFGDFLASRANIAELDDSNAQLHKVRLRRGEDR